MEAITVSTILLAIVGQFIFMGLQMIELQVTKGDDFRMRLYFKRNYLRLIVSYLQIGVLLYFAPGFAVKVIDCHIHEGSHFYELFAFGIGFMTDVFWYKLIETIKKKYKV